MRNSIELENGTVLEVGKKYVHATWLNDTIYEVTAIGRNLFVYAQEGCDYELTHEIDNDWIPYEEPKTEKWVEYLNRRGNGDFYHKCYIKLRDIEELDSYDTIIIREWDSKEEMIKDLKKC